MRPPKFISFDKFLRSIFFNKGKNVVGIGNSHREATQSWEKTTLRSSVVTSKLPLTTKAGNAQDRQTKRWQGATESLN